MEVSLFHNDNLDIQIFVIFEHRNMSFLIKHHVNYVMFNIYISFLVAIIDIWALLQYQNTLLKEFQK